MYRCCHICSKRIADLHRAKRQARANVKSLLDVVAVYEEMLPTASLEDTSRDALFGVNVSNHSEDSTGT